MFNAVFPFAGSQGLALLVSSLGSIIGASIVFFALKYSVGKWFRKKVEKNEKVVQTIQRINKVNTSTLILLLSNPYTPTSIFNYAMAISGFQTKKYLLVISVSRIIELTLLGLLGIIFQVGDGIVSFVWITLTYIIVYMLIWLWRKCYLKRRKKMNKKTIKDVELKGKVVLIRVDFNVPMKDGIIVDDNRIVQALPTIKYAIEHGGKIVLFSHLGRVKEEADKADNTLAPVAKRLSEL